MAVQGARVPRNLGGGPSSLGDVHEVIVHRGSDSSGGGGLAFHRGAERREVQAAVDAADCLPASIIAAARQRSGHLPSRRAGGVSLPGC